LRCHIVSGRIILAQQPTRIHKRAPHLPLNTVFASRLQRWPDLWTLIKADTNHKLRLRGLIASGMVGLDAQHRRMRAYLAANRKISRLERLLTSRKCNLGEAYDVYFRTF